MIKLSLAMKRTIAFWAFLSLLLAGSCSRIEESSLQENTSGKVELTVTASIGQSIETKTIRQDDGSIEWLPGDAINLFYGTMDGGKFTTTISEASPTATFNGTLSAATGSSEAGMGAQSFWGVYPYDESNTCDGESVTMTVPGTQKGVPGTFANNLNPTVAKSSGLNLSFYNVGSWFIFSVSQAGITSATFRGNNNEDLAGKVRVTMGSDGRPTVSEVLGGVKSITITPQTGSSFEVGKEYRIVLLPQTLSAGYTLTLRKGPQASDCVVNKEAEFVRSSYRRKLSADAGLEWSGEFVAMGDGINWGTKNIGANNPQESGYYFAWGETETKTSYSWDTYKWGTAYNELTKYNDDSNFGTVDNPTYLYLQSDDDAARVNLGPGWLTPQKSDWQWLIDNCTWEWTDDYDGSGAKGYVVTSNVDGYTSNSIFLPTAGFYMNATARQRHLGYYWSANHGRMNPAVGEEKCVPYMAWYMSFTSSGHQVSSVDRIYGIPVRPIYREVAATGVFISSTSLALDYGEEASLTAIVLPASATNRNVIWSSSDPSIVSVTQEGALTAVGIGTATVTVTTEDGGYTGSCSVTVTGISVESVSLDHTILTIAKDATAQLTATVLPENASNPAVTWSSSDETIATVSEDGIVTGIKAGSATITVTTEDGNKTTSCQVTVEMAINGHTFVEMGDGLKWATMNVGANSETDYGDYFAWGETEPYYSGQDPLMWKEGKSAGYGWGSYSHMYTGMASQNGISKYQVADGQTDSMWYYDGEFVGDGMTELERTDDAASVNWGGTWRMPTDAEWTELLNTAKFIWSWDSTRKGYTVTSKVPGYAGNQIFLPAAGRWNGTSLDYVGSDGYYWSSSLDTSYSYYAWYVRFSSSYEGRNDNYLRYYGRSVRPVSE